MSDSSSVKSRGIDINGLSPLETAGMAISKAAIIDDVRTIAGKDLTVGKEGDRVVVSFAYVREIHLVGPAHLVMKYEGRSK